MEESAIEMLCQSLSNKPTSDDDIFKVVDVKIHVLRYMPSHRKAVNFRNRGMKCADAEHHYFFRNDKCEYFNHADCAIRLK